MPRLPVVPALRVACGLAAGILLLSTGLPGGGAEAQVMRRDAPASAQNPANVAPPAAPAATSPTPAAPAAASGAAKAVTTEAKDKATTEAKKQAPKAASAKSKPTAPRRTVVQRKRPGES